MTLREFPTAAALLLPTITGIGKPLDERLDPDRKMPEYQAPILSDAQITKLMTMGARREQKGAWPTKKEERLAKLRIELKKAMDGFTNQQVAMKRFVKKGEAAKKRGDHKTLARYLSDTTNSHAHLAATQKKIAFLMKEIETLLQELAVATAEQKP